jgi:hypothetical protein
MGLNAIGSYLLRYSATASVNDFPVTLEEDNYHLKLGIEQSLQSLPSTEKSARQDFTEEPDY